MNNGTPKNEGIRAVILPESLAIYEKKPQRIRIEPESIAKFGIVRPRNLNSLLMGLRE
jgi:hypothetical protein